MPIFKQAQRQLLIHAIVFHEQQPQCPVFFLFGKWVVILFGGNGHLQPVTNRLIEALRGAAV